MYPRQLRQALSVGIEQTDATACPSALDVACLGRDQFRHGQVVTAAEALPNYLRMEVARPKGSRALTIAEGDPDDAI